MNESTTTDRNRITNNISLLSDDDIYLFNEGTHGDLQAKLGAHLASDGDTPGTYFSVWARMRVRCRCSALSTDGTRRGIGCGRAPVPGSGKDLYQASGMAHSINSTSCRGKMAIRLISQIHLACFMKWLRRQRPSSGTSVTSGAIKLGCSSGGPRTASMPPCRSMKSILVPGSIGRTTLPFPLLS